MTETNDKEGLNNLPKDNVEWWQHASQMSQIVDDDTSYSNPAEEADRTEATSLSYHNQTTSSQPRILPSAGADPARPSSARIFSYVESNQVLIKFSHLLC